MKKYLTINTLGWVVTLLTSLMLLMSGVQKIAGSEEMVNNFTSTHLLPYLFLVGLMEVATASLLMYPKTTIYGAVLLTCIMSAAAVIHLSYMNGSGVLIPVILGLSGWIGYFLRSNKLQKV